MNPLISAAWLADHLDDPNLVILDATLPPVGVTPTVDTRARYLERHIPGAIFFDIDELSDHSTNLPHMLPTAEKFAHDMSALGISEGASIVVYEQAAVFSAPRAWWMLRTFGVEEVHILDGGLQVWIEAGFPTHSGSVESLTAQFTPRFNRDAVKDFAYIQKVITENGQILDARSSGRFNGTAPEPRPGISSGHMSGAISTPFTEMLDHGRLRSAPELRQYFALKGVDLDRPITTTCGSGVTAAVISLGLEIAGATQVGLYDGSWAEYAQRPESLIEKGENGR